MELTVSVCDNIYTVKAVQEGDVLFVVIPHDSEDDLCISAIGITDTETGARNFRLVGPGPEAEEKDMDMWGCAVLVAAVFGMLLLEGEEDQLCIFVEHLHNIARAET